MGRLVSVKSLGRLFLWGGLALSVGSFFADLDGISRPAQSCISIFFLAMTMWVTRLIPLPITSLLVLVLLPLMGVMSRSESFSLFGNEAVFFILGALILSTGLRRTGLTRRMAVYFLGLVRGGPAGLLGAILTTSILMSFLMPVHAVVVMLLPVVLDIVEALGLKKHKSNYAKGLLLALAWGAGIGSISTFLGGARNPLALAIYSERYHESIGFFEWMLAMSPIALGTGAFAYFVILRFFPIDVETIKPAHDFLLENIEKMGKISRNEIVTGVIMVLTIFAWMFFSDTLGFAVISLLAVALIFLLRVMTWEEMEQDIYWGTIVMYGGAIALASAMTSTGAAEWMVNRILNGQNLHPVGLVIFLAVLTKVVTELISNSAAAALLLPVSFVLGDQAGVNPLVIIYTVGGTAGLAFSLPMGTPANAICLGTGYYSVRDALKPGFILNFISLAVFLFVALVYWPLIGLGI